MAVKVIDKLRFPHKQDAALRQEVTILQVGKGVGREGGEGCREGERGRVGRGRV